MNKSKNRTTLFISARNAISSMLSISMWPIIIYEGVSKSFQTGHLERELQKVQLSATRHSCIAIL
jgi:hypothetical protein